MTYCTLKFTVLLVAFTMLDSTLMIRVRALHGAVPANAFLRIARELAFVAAEVGRMISLSAEAGSATTSTYFPSPGAAFEEAGFGLPDLPNGWSIVRAESGGESAETARVEGQSVALVIAPPQAQREAVQCVRAGVREIQAGVPERPAGFSDAALRGLRRAATLSGRQLQVSLSSGQGEGEAVALDATTVAQVDGWLSGQRDAIGSVEGHLDVISVHNRPRFTIYGRHGERIECLFEAALLPEVKSALGERVCIRGRVTYRKDGIPATVEARWLRQLRPQSQSPAVAALLG